eukprot:TRINITY_DN6472_c0_g1_i1.p2 TRINITY_DN6472_c0_g1~~TRINITY_DN6472_c0_g1_i1.p2  ORF type:complete len:233 (+),score=34.39 TRINITY_DN6472_c0_g1_i1:183-881(+)
MCIRDRVSTQSTWDFKEIEQAEEKKDQEILYRLNMIGIITDQMKNGNKITVRFKLAPQLTKALTLSLYKQILISQIYLHYTEIQNYIKKNANIQMDQIASLVAGLEDRVTEIRNELLERSHVEKAPTEDFRYVLQKAFYTHRTNDQEFEECATKMLVLYSTLQKMVYSQVIIPEFKVNPRSMTLEEFELFYSFLEAKYSEKPKANEIEDEDDYEDAESGGQGEVVPEDTQNH